MSEKLNPYGLPQAVNRPKLKAVKSLDLSTLEGQQIVKAETRRVLQIHNKTFQKLADM